VSHSLTAQPGYQFESLTETNGLSDNRVTCFLKDKTGFMWIGTENGLNRFDGHSFLVYQPGFMGHSISNPFINDIEEDGLGRLWVATQSGLNVIDGQKDSVFVFLPGDNVYENNEKSIPSDLIWDTYADKQNRIWIAADVRDLCYYDIKKQLFVYLPWKKYFADKFPDRRDSYNSIRKIYYKSDNELWLGTAAGLFSYTISSGEFNYYKSQDTDHFIQLEASPDGKTVYYVQSPGNTLQTLSLTDGVRKEIPWNSIPSSRPSAYHPIDAKYKRWLPAGKDIVEINSLTDETILIKPPPTDPRSLADGIVRVVYRENTGLVWTGTSNGIGKFNPFINLFSFIEVLPPLKRDPMPDNDLYRTDHAVHTVLYSSRDSQYYISSPATNRLWIKNKRSGQLRQVENILGIPLLRCSVLFEDSKGMLWILAAKNAFRYDRLTGRFDISSFRPQSGNLLFTDMAEDAEGNLWIASLNDGVYCYNPGKNTTRKISFNSTLPTSLYFDREQNKLWVGTFEKGIYIYDMNKKKFSHFPQNSKNHIHSSLINDITKDKNGTIWIATYAGGIARYSSLNPGANEYARITTQDGLPENNIYSLQTDLEGNTWATSFKGLTQIGPDGRIIENFNRSKGLNFTNFYSPFSLTPDGELMTGVTNGFIQFHPDSLYHASPDFPVIITSFRVNDSSRIGNQLKVLSYTENEIQFDFAALSYLNPPLTRYEYWLEGVDKNWVKAGKINTTKYNNLVPGSYTFKVRAFDFTGKISSNVATASFKILPPWWQTWWFRVLAALAIIGIILLLFKRWIQVIKNKALIRQQMTELKGQALRAQMNPHFIFNCLNAIQELIVLENYTASYKYLSKFSKLLRMVLNMSEKNFIQLSNELEMCHLYVELESMRFKNSFEYTIHTDKRIDPETVFFPSLLVQPFIENAIWHGLLQKEGEKKLTINFEENNGKLTCTIRDNGIGREKAASIKAQKIGSRHFDSRGMELARQRMENLQAAGLNDAEIEIIDCKDEKGNATGTMVRITISSPENTEA
jgi:ligand-binding sensor domain-containing protein/two-component sensor histidine kinase